MSSMDGGPARQQALRDQRRRPQAFLNRKECGGTHSWRPKKRHRKAAFQWLCHLHMQLSPVIDEDILHFQAPSLAADRPPASSWPRLSLSPDQGSDGVSGISYLIQKLNTCAEASWDFSHGVHNAILGGLKEAGLCHHIVLSLIRLNVPVSPWQEDTQFQQPRRAATELLDNETLGNCEMHTGFAQEMLLEPAGQEFAANGRGDEDLWEAMESSNPFANKGTKSMLGIYLGVIRKMREESKHDAQRKSFYLYVALEFDTVGNKEFARLASSTQEHQ